MLPSVRPPLVIKEDDIHDSREKYSLSASVRFCAPNSSELASGFGVEEMTIYEAFFESSFTDKIPALVASICDFFKISLAQFNLPTWRTLVAIRNLGKFENIPFGINKVLFAYHLAPLNGGDGRF